MSDFLSINPAPETININGTKFPVHGVSMMGFGNLIPRFPNLVTDLQERFKKDGGLTVQGIFEVSGPAIGPILAAGLGYPGNEEAEKRCEQYDATTQTKLLNKILSKTMPDGFGPFVEGLAGLMQRFTPPAAASKPRFKILPNTSNVSSESSDTPLSKSGA